MLSNSPRLVVVRYQHGCWAIAWRLGTWYWENQPQQLLPIDEECLWDCWAATTVMMSAVYKVSAGMCLWPLLGARTCPGYYVWMLEAQSLRTVWLPVRSDYKSKGVWVHGRARLYHPQAKWSKSWCPWIWNWATRRLGVHGFGAKCLPFYISLNRRSFDVYDTPCKVDGGRNKIMRLFATAMWVSDSATMPGVSLECLNF